MAPVALNVSPALRPWRRAGLVRLLADKPLAEALRAAARPAAGTAAPRNDESRNDESRNDESLPSSQSPQSARQPRNPALRPRPAPPDIAPPDIAPPAADSPDEVRSAPWPDAWQSLWRRVGGASARPAVVWSYAELGEDLCGPADSGRRQALRDLLADLRLPKGSHAFWPYRLPPDNAPDPEMFLAGLNRFRPGLVLLAGERAVAELAGLSGEAEAAGLGSLPTTSFQLASCRGFRCMLLPGLDAAAEMAGPRRDQMIALIRAAAP